MRGVLLDIASCKGVPHLEPNYGITAQDIEDCIAWSGVELRKNDAVMLRTGERWPEMDYCPNAGMTLESCRYLIEEKGAVLLGNDQVAFESVPSWPEHPHPVHHYCLIQQGVHFIEMVLLDELAKDKAYEFCFIVSSNKIKGGTGMFVRPLAIV
jgi:kynurenine formamidase